MKIDYVSYFVTACKSVMESFGIPIESGDVSVRQSPFQADAIIIVIGVTGDLHGQAMLIMQQETACSIASIMMGGMDMEMNEVTKSAVAELSNMIIGNAVTLLSQENVMIDITPPTVLTGDNIHVSTTSISMSVPFDLPDGKPFEFSLSAKELVI